MVGSRVRLNDVWDRTVDVLRGRSAILVPIAALAIFVPTVINSGIVTYVAPGTGGAAGLGALLSLIVVVTTVWGTLAMIAVATDPATDRAEAGRQATQRLLPAIGVVLAMGALFTLLAVPIVVALIQGGMDFARPDTARNLSGGVAAFVTFYALALIVVAFWLSARLMILNPVILNERRGLAAIPRSVRLTTGLTWRLIGVLLLFSIVVAVPTLAVQAVVGIVFRLVLGAEAIATAQFLAAIAGSVVTAGFSIVAAAFTAQLYVALRGREAPLPV